MKDWQRREEKIPFYSWIERNYKDYGNRPSSGWLLVGDGRPKAPACATFAQAFKVFTVNGRCHYVNRQFWLVTSAMT